MKVPKAYLFKIASNTWIDQCRKKKIQVEFTEDNLSLDYFTSDIDHFEIEEAVDILGAILPAKQAVVIIYIEVFKFSINEIANMIVN